MSAATLFRHFVISGCFALGTADTALFAQETKPVDPGMNKLDEIVVVASRSPRPLSEIAAEVTVIDAADIQRNMAEDINGLLRYSPGLEVESSGTRFGATSINVRGIGGNRVAIEQDGMTVRDRFVVGAFSDSGRTRVETDRIKRVEVLYGPASVLYGSDALGGIVAITTWDPDDLLDRGTKSHSLGLRGGYQGADDSWVGSGIAAVGNDTHGLLFAGTLRAGHQLENRAPEGTPQDPQDWNNQDFMLRYTFDSPGGNRLRLTAMGQDSEVDTQMNSLLGYSRRFRTTTALWGSDQDSNRQYAVSYDFTWAGWQQGKLQLFHTDYSTEQLTHEIRGTAIPPVALEREFSYDQDHDGLNVSLFRTEQWGSSEHRIGLGLQWLQTDTSELRDGLQTNLLTGSTTNEILGETLPVRDFPNSRSRELGLFVQDEISLAGGRWELIPAVRWDDYQLDPRHDDLWLEDFPDMAIAAVSENDFTPRLGAVYHPGDVWSVYGQYASGFRAPPFEDANIGLDIPLFGYRAIPNPDLKSETSHGFELGARRITSTSRFSIALFDTEYDDFIESRASLGIDEDTGDLIFQSINIGKASIYGMDLGLDQDLGAWNDVLQGLTLRVAAFWARGENRQSDEPLNSIAPPQAVLGISWAAPSGNWELGLTSTVTAAKHAADINEEVVPRFATPSWITLDFTSSWRCTRWLELRAGVFNIGNETYWRWLDVARLDASDPMIPVLSRPGRNYSFTARVSF